MVSVRLPDGLYRGMNMISKSLETTLTNVIEYLCCDSIDSGFYPDCKEKLFPDGPFDIDKVRNCNKGEVAD